MIEPPLVSVVLPTHNRLPLLTRTLDSVLAQRDVRIEVVVVDEASSDGTADALETRHDPRIRIIRHCAPHGVAAARNAGIARAKGEWLAFTDDDDLWAPDKLAAQLEEVGPDVGWVAVGSITTDPELRIVAGMRPPQPDRFDDILTRNIIPGGGSGVLARTSLVRQLGGFDTELSIIADWDMWMRLYAAAPLRTVDRPLVAYLRHPTSMSHVNDGLRRELVYIAHKHAELRHRRSAEFDMARWDRWDADMHVRAGRRRDALALYWRVARASGGHHKLAARSVVVAIWPELLVELWVRRSLRRLPRWWLDEAEAWLAAHRSAADLPAPVPDWRG